MNEIMPNSKLEYCCKSFDKYNYLFPSSRKDKKIFYYVREEFYYTGELLIIAYCPFCGFDLTHKA